MEHKFTRCTVFDVQPVSRELECYDVIEECLDDVTIYTCSSEKVCYYQQDVELKDIITTKKVK